LYENATRAAWAQTLAEAQEETAAIWSGFSHVASANPAAWLQGALSPEQILEDGPGNPMLSFPYRKLMVANGSVNQGAAVVLASLSMARELGIADERLIYVGYGASSHEPDDFLLRDSYAHSASLTTSIKKALAFNNIEADALDCVELYSCFPCVPKMARRVLGWPLDRPHSVYGGLTFGGGPIGNCMTHATAAMTVKLRRGAGNGMIVANGGYATHNHSILLSSDQARGMRSAADYHVDAAAASLRNNVPQLIDTYEGVGKVETYVVPYGRDGTPSSATIIARNPAGQRFLASVSADDSVALDQLVTGRVEPIGLTGQAAAVADGRMRWTF
jgi:acetyl-CoA C-acetyltransferase